MAILLTKSDERSAVGLPLLGVLCVIGRLVKLLTETLSSPEGPA